MAFKSYNWLKLLAAHDMRAAMLRFIPIQIALLAFKVVQELSLYGGLDTSWPMMMVEVFMVSVPFVAFGLWLLSRLDKLQDELFRFATRDILTNLPNRRSFFDQVQSKLPDPGGMILMMDVDHFKRVNDNYGHSVGDQCLQQIAEFLKEVCDSDDIVARFGGEEFAALLVGLTAEETALLGDRIAEGFEFQLPGTSRNHRVTLSVGAVHSDSLINLDQCLQIADDALYRAKKAGRARLVFAQNGEAALQMVG